MLDTFIKNPVITKLLDIFNGAVFLLNIFRLWRAWQSKHVSPCHVSSRRVLKELLKTPQKHAATILPQLQNIIADNGHSPTEVFAQTNEYSRGLKWLQ